MYKYIFVLWGIIALTGVVTDASAQERKTNKELLREGWLVQSSEKVGDRGEVISTASFNAREWFPTTVPSTVLGALVRNNVYPTIWIGDSLRKIPVDQFKQSWWFRKEFSVSPVRQGNHITLSFDGIIYRANIWLNGTLIARSDTTAGVYRRFEFDVTDLIVRGETNVLAVEIIPPQPGEPSVGFVDWNPKPPDASMGIWRDVGLKFSGDVSIDNPYVASEVDVETFHRARLTVSAVVSNHSALPVKGLLKGTIEKIFFETPVILSPHETKTIEFTPDVFRQLEVTNPRLWWSHDVGKPELYDLLLEFRVGEIVSDLCNVRFGIRQITDYINEDGHRGYKLNGRKILIRGGGWTDDLLLEYSPERLKAQVEYVRHMNLNTIRSEGLWGNNEDFFDLCDENGILIMYGYSCQWEWKGYFGNRTDRRYGGITSPENIALVSRMWKDQVLWLRNHPSIFVWVYASDLLPTPELERNYVSILKAYDPMSPSLASAKGLVSDVTGPTGVKMRGPYEYVPPVYWYVDMSKGGAFGFNTETGPGAQVPPIESVRRMIPAKNLWPQDSVWDFHCSRGQFRSLNRYNEAMNSRLGKPSSVEEYCMKAQFQNYEAMRGMYEAFTANKHHATGVIQWMLNSAWPKLFWQLYDWYLMPTGAFYGAKQACQPYHVLYNYGTRDIIAVNNTFDSIANLTVHVRVLNFDLSEKYSRVEKFPLQPDQALILFQLPEISGLSATYFVDIRLFDIHQKLIGANFYPLSTRPELLDDSDESDDNWFVTRVKQYADYTLLNTLENIYITEHHAFTYSEGGVKATITLKNPSPALAFCIEVMIKHEQDGEPVVPIFFSDNYITLIPGEERIIEGIFEMKDLHGQKPLLQVRGWNIHTLQSNETKVNR